MGSLLSHCQLVDMAGRVGEGMLLGSVVKRGLGDSRSRTRGTAQHNRGSAKLLDYARWCQETARGGRGSASVHGALACAVPCPMRVVLSAYVRVNGFDTVQLYKAEPYNGRGHARPVRLRHLLRNCGLETSGDRHIQRGQGSGQRRGARRRVSCMTAV